MTQGREQAQPVNGRYAREASQSRWDFRRACERRDKGTGFPWQAAVVQSRECENGYPYWT